jgi:electron transfer flavoprotein alpha subunit
MKNNVIVYSEDIELASELLTPAREIATSTGGKVIMIVIYKVEMNDYTRLVGADVIVSVRLPDELGVPTPEFTSAVVADIFKSRGAGFVLLGSTRDGKELAGRLAVILDASAATDCINIQFKENRALVERLVYGGRVLSSGILEAGPFVIGIKPRSYQAIASGPEPSIEEFSIQSPVLKTRVLRSGEAERGSVDLTKADKIVAVGRGLKKKEDLELIHTLAEALGAAVGCSRPLSSDLGWLPEDAHIGLTGIQVKPKLYLAVGISGQLQHLAGIKDSKVIMAINSDKGAPIFQNCDYGAVGDLYQIVPELTKLIKAKR